MTTDRTAASTRSTALADRPASAAGRTPAPPTDMFSALLGAATPKSDAPGRREDNASSHRRDDHPRADKPKRPDDAHRPHQRDDASRPAPKADDKPVADASAPTTDATTEPTAEDKPTAPTTPSLFALQLASPLPPQTAAPVQAPAETPALPVFAGQVPASVAAATTAQTTGTTAAATGAVAASAATEAAAVTTAATTETPGAIALQGLPAEATADTTLPAGLDLTKPQAQAPATDTPATAAQDATTLPSSPQQQASADAQSQEESNTPAQPNTMAPQAAKPADAPAPAQPVTTSPIAPAAAPAMPSTPTVERAVPLSRALHTTGVMVRMMADKGVNHARLNLKPAELGGIEVRLRSTGDGVHALLVADSPEAARMLAGAGDDLRRQLEDKNVNLLSLDVSTSDKREDQPAGFNADGFGADDYRPGRSNMSRSSGNESALLMEAPASADTVLVLPDGVHVDVLA